MTSVYFRGIQPFGHHWHIMSRAAFNQRNFSRTAYILYSVLILNVSSENTYFDMKSAKTEIHIIAYFILQQRKKIFGLHTFHVLKLYKSIVICIRQMFILPVFIDTVRQIYAHLCFKCSHITTNWLLQKTKSFQISHISIRQNVYKNLYQRHLLHNFPNLSTHNTSDRRIHFDVQDLSKRFVWSV